MSVIFADGFDWMSGHSNAFETQWSAASTATAFYEPQTSALGPAVGCYGGSAASWPGLWINFNNSTYSELILSCAFYPYARNGGSEVDFFYFVDNDTSHVKLTIQPFSTVFKVKVGASTVATLPYLGYQKWHWISMRIKFHSTAGTIKIHVDGNQLLNLTGINTLATANAYCNRVIIGASAIEWYLDDLIICDTTGTSMNDILTSRRILTLFPNAAGDSSAWSRNGNSFNYQSAAFKEWKWGNPIDISTALSQSVYSSTVGQQDLYNLPDSFTSTMTIDGVKLNSLACRQGVGARTMKHQFKLGSTVYEGHERTLLPSPSGDGDYYAVSPATGLPFTPTELNGAQIGVKVQS